MFSGQSKLIGALRTYARYTVFPVPDVSRGILSIAIVTFLEVTQFFIKCTDYFVFTMFQELP